MGPMAYKADSHQKIMKKEDSRNQPPETGRRIVRLLYAYE